MYKGANKVKVIILVLCILAATSCGVKTDPVPPESPLEVAPTKSPTPEPTPKKKSDKDGR